MLCGLLAGTVSTVAILVAAGSSGYLVPPGVHPGNVRVAARSRPVLDLSALRCLSLGPLASASHLCLSRLPLTSAARLGLSRLPLASASHLCLSLGSLASASPLGLSPLPLTSASRVCLSPLPRPWVSRICLSLAPPTFASATATHAEVSCGSPLSPHTQIGLAINLLVVTTCTALGYRLCGGGGDWYQCGSGDGGTGDGGTARARIVTSTDSTSHSADALPMQQETLPHSVVTELFGPQCGGRDGKSTPREPARIGTLVAVLAILTICTAPFWRRAGEQDDVALLLPRWADLTLVFNLMLGVTIAGAIRLGWELPPDAPAPAAAASERDPGRRGRGRGAYEVEVISVPGELGGGEAR